MKKHLLGFCIAFLIISGFIYYLPIRFKTVASYSFTMPDTDNCFANVFNSNYFKKIGLKSCDYKTTELATDNFYKIVNEGFEINKNLELIEQVEENKTTKRAIMGFPFENKPSYCLIRKDGNQVAIVVSDSLHHVKEFERQKFIKFNNEE
jgi:hypothetical protein